MVKEEVNRSGIKKPTVHRNGTSGEDLFDYNLNAVHVLRDAEEALAKAAPNGRDYYVQEDPRAFAIASEEHQKRQKALKFVREQLEEIAEDIQDQIER